jgi:hypothetical protein
LGRYEENYKLQNTNYKQITIPKLQITNKAAPFGHLVYACGEKREAERREDRKLGS